MKFVLFYHSLVSDWNHGNAHFLRGIASDLIARGHQVDVYEPANGWSSRNLREQQGDEAARGFARAYPELSSHQYDLAELDLERALDAADVVIVHEWNDPQLISRVGASAARKQCRLFFHDTHHRSVTDPDAIAALDLRHYHGVLAFGRTVADRYLRHGWAHLAWVWHEAADVRRFHPLAARPNAGDIVWVGNWGDEERSTELRRFLIDPVARLGASAKIFGVRYPEEALRTLRAANIEYGGWIANHQVPEIFARYRCTLHVPRRAYAQSLQGVPTIRMFEALACGIPLISAPWSDTEALFEPGKDYLVARDGEHMLRHLRAVLSDAALACDLAARGRQTILNRHTCTHRVEELLRIVAGLDVAARQRGESPRRAHG